MQKKIRLLIFGATYFLISNCNNNHSTKDDQTKDTIIVTPSVINYDHHIEITSEDLLGDFCYPLFTFSPKTVGNGTCILFEKKGSLVIITNTQVISGLKFNGDGDTNDKIKIEYPNFRGDKSILPVSILDPNNFLRKSINVEKDTALFKIEIPFIPYDGKFTFMSNLIDTEYFNKIPEEVLCYGYQWEAFFKNQQNHKTVKPYLIKGNYIMYRDYLKKLANIKSMNPNEIEKESNIQMGKKYFCINGLISDGMFGSPVFGRFATNKNGKNTDVYKFIGLVCAIDAKAKMSLVIKAKIVLDTVNE
jgi:hypothetical protein